MMGKAEEEDGLRTVDCLRGRLLAERVASKAAKAQVDLMAKKVAELERQLDVEIKCRNRAEKRLNSALKKMESLKLSLSQSSTSSSPGCLLDFQRSEESKPNCKPMDSGQCGTRGEVETAQGLSGSEELGRDVCSSDSSVGLPLRLVSQEGSWSSVGTMHSDGKGGGAHHKENGEPFGHLRLHDGKELEGTQDHSEIVENSLALVPVGMWPDSGDGKSSVSNDVQRVLDSLRHVKEQLQDSIRRIAADRIPMELYGR